MTTTRNKYSNIACLIGENPLPAYFAIQQFAGDGGTVDLVCSRETQVYADALRHVFGSPRWHDQGLSLRSREVDPHSPKSVVDAMNTIGVGLRASHPALLDYTGGTKVMAAWSLYAWRKDGDENRHAVYLSDLGDQFVNVPGYSPITVADHVCLSLADLTQLHDNRLTGTQERFEHGLNFEQLHRLYVDFVKNGSPLRHLADGLRSTGEAYKFLQRDCGLRIWSDVIAYLGSVSGDQAKWDGCGVSDAASKSAYEKSPLRGCLEWAHGKWFEDYVGYYVKRAFPAEDGGETHSSLMFTPGASRKDSEADYLVLSGRRMLLISITTSTRQATIKGKAFEAYFRARQLGGGLARWCVVTPAGTEVVSEVAKETRIATAVGQNILGDEVIGDWHRGQFEGLTGLF